MVGDVDELFVVGDFERLTGGVIRGRVRVRVRVPARQRIRSIGEDVYLRLGMRLRLITLCRYLHVSASDDMNF